MRRRSPANRLLRSLPPGVRLRFLRHLEPVELHFGQLLYEPERMIRHVYFPLDCLISLLSTVDDQRSLEVGMVGNEGMAGLPVVLGVARSGVRAIVQSAGSALRIPTERIQRELEIAPQLRQALLRYACAFMTQMSQNAACNRFHHADQRLARWLLMTHDRIHADHFALTQEFIARMLGLRRAGITTSANALRQRGLIDYRRGRLRVLDGPGLERASCCCYRKVNAVLQRPCR